MTFISERQPAIALVDDDFYSARLLIRTIEAHGGPSVVRMADPDLAAEALTDMSRYPARSGQCMVVVDLKHTSTATRDFVARLKHDAPSLLVVAMAPSLDREARETLLEAGAAAVFERHADLALYRLETASIVAFWVRSQRLDAVGT